jgi:DNA repair protein SbcD/Mre11
MHQPFRFLHASDLHLDQPPRGLTEVPDHLRAALVDAPYRAAERIFDAAIREHVDFLVLAGDVTDPLMAGPRALVFLTEQFERLGAADITTYWATGRSDHFERWPQLAWPDRVIRFPPGRPLRVVHHKQGTPLVEILGTSSEQRRRIRTDDFHPEGGGLMTVVVAYGSTDAESVARQGVHYWALGGEHQRRSLISGPVTAHYCGTPQGRRPQESGPRGCTLVQVDLTQRVRSTFIPTDVVRYQLERVAVNESTTRPQLQQILDERTRELLSDPFGPELLVQWSILGSRKIAAELTRGTLGVDLSSELRAAHGQRRPAAWTVSIDAEPAGPVADDRYEEQTVLGEFLRTVRHYVDHPDDPIDLHSYLHDRHAKGHVGSAVALDDPALRRRVLAEVARLGVDLLGPEEVRT